MKWWGLMVVLAVILVVAGFFVFQTTTPQSALQEADDTGMLIEDDSTPGSNLLQLQPDSLPPGNEVDEADSDLPAGVPGPPGEGTDAEATDTTAATGETVVISMTDTGFVPAEISIAPGTTVTFVNNGQGTHWPASDVHPTHEILSEFDSNQGLSTGEQYSFVFTDPGTWDFHDHLNPRLGGTVKVE